VSIVYTPWSNLKKTSDMAVGQIGYHSSKLVKKALVEKKDNTIIKMLEKTRVGNGAASAAPMASLHVFSHTYLGCRFSLLPGGKPP
jgi:hypothetical protein